ncbi:RNA polymerase-associated protein RapA [Acaryochloris thomasi RCC1774]|uniref:RNA polymerase-associated protein RapA n=1 Tax=Acaryochloris thomasi RCC1774 TaxID=1764569 RepID=A0A2W1JDN9_9CYAN|nr:DEAD/DEAH box helicase [Acaryochloris thomasi]PZD71858.1 RNA polymerase-associated protein RapA [Acaryochloris thomasi RCC1774]
MAILHGNWLPAAQQGYDSVAETGSLFLWGETWRRATPIEKPSQVTPHALAMTAVELAAHLVEQLEEWKLAQAVKDAIANPPKKPRKTKKPGPVYWGNQTVSLLAQWEENNPTVCHSTVPITESVDLALQPVQITGLHLSLPEAIAFLNALPLNPGRVTEQSLGDDLIYWTHTLRWGLDLLARGKFLPALSPVKGKTYVAHWRPLFDSAADQARHRQFAARMPSACRFYQEPSSDAQIDLPPEPDQILTHFLQQVVGYQVRGTIDPELEKTLDKAGLDPLLQEWIKSLGPEVTPLNKGGDRLEVALREWTAPLQQSLQQDFRPCFHLQTPSSGRNDWKLEYWLQAIDDASFLISAEVVWSTPTEQLDYLGRTIDRPQETLLVGLGLASRVYPILEESLESARPTGTSLTPAQAYEFIKAAVWRLEDSGFGVILPPSLANREGLANRLGLQVKAQAQDPSRGGPIGLESLLKFGWELAIGGQTLSKAEFDRLVAQDSPLVEINGEWVELRSQDIRAAQAFFESRQDQTGLSLQDALRISTGDTLTLDKLPVVNFESSGPLQALLNTLSGNQTLEAAETPEKFKGELRPYQARGVGWLEFLEQWGLGACLADDMGLGKTIQFIAFMLALKEKDRLNGPALLICPTSVLGNWEREVKKFGPSIKVMVHHGTDRDQGTTFARTVKKHDLVVTSYPLVYRDEKSLKKVDWWGIVLDEAQNIKNSEARQSKAVRELQAHCRIALTGTPVENRLTELWSILDFLNPGYLGPKPFFKRRFATPIEKYGDTASLQTLRSLVQPFILRRTKSDRDIIQDLPDKQEMIVFCSLSPGQADLYEKVVQDSLDAVEAAEGIQRHGLILSTLVKLKQICNHPAQFLKDDSLEDHRSGKLHRLDEMLEEVLDEGDRALIFTQFAEWGKLLQQHLQRKTGKETLLLYGGTSKKKREEMIDRFQHDPQGPRLFILSLKAGGVGLNLTRANHVFHFDRWWNPAVENQATDRVFRIGQTRNVQVHKFVCNGTLEERIHEQIESKKALAEQVVGAGENWLTELDTDQLRNLLLLDRSAVIDEEA